MRHFVRRVLKRAGLLDLAREGRDWIGSARSFRHNLQFWLHGSSDGLPVPPVQLVRSSTGIWSLEWYFHGGTLAADSIRDALQRNGIAMAPLGAILDLGCGSGRVVRQWAALPARVHGCDYNPRVVAWCRRHLPFAEFEVNGIEPPLPYAADQFDLVYALSVFTHLGESLLQPWMQELRRVLKPGGFLILTTHGDTYLPQLTAEEQRRFHEGRPVIRHEEESGTNRCGVYFSEQFIRQQLAAGFHVVEFVPQGAKGNPQQDLTLLQRLPASRG